MSRQPSIKRRKKPAGKTTMKDLHNEHVQLDKMAPVNDGDGPQDFDSPIDGFKFDEDFEQKLVKYNENVLTLDSDYTSLTPRADILVRVFVKELEKTEAGLILPNKTQVQIPTRSGVGVLGEMDNPYPYSQKAVVISVPVYITDLKAGDVVILNSPTVMGVATGQGDDAMISIRFGFTHPDFYNEQHLPSDPDNKNYGYLALPSQEVKFVTT